MSEKPSIEPSSSEVPLDDLDALLDQEDPGFRTDLKSVSDIQPESEVDQESSVDISVEEHAEGDLSQQPDDSRWQQIKSRVKMSLTFQLGRLKAETVGLFFKLLVFLKTKPIEFLKYGLVQLKAIFGLIGALLRRFSDLPKAQKGLVFLTIILSVGVVMLTLKNLKGTWIPTLNPPLVTSLSQKADEVFFISEDKGEAFYRAFPRDPDIFLFKKFKVNLRPTEGHPNPMGAFEVVIEVDSKEAAVEAQDRETELHDLVQREFETMAYPSLLTDLGKQQLKNQVKKTIDDRLSQGWVEDVHFQTFILKP